ncbi:MAG: CapA family protein [Lachnospiraceae bacterium]|nr:CapA family protein [Lachnospiraceae bacterium]
MWLLCTLVLYAFAGCGGRDEEKPSSMEEMAVPIGETPEEESSAGEPPAGDKLPEEAQGGKDSGKAALPVLPELRLIMVGDILLHTPVEESAHLPDGSYDFSPIFANEAEHIAAADLALVNQEVIIGGEALGVSGYPAFNAPTQIGDALVDAGFDVICQATNHALDKGKRGILNDLAYWEEAHPEIAVLGIQDTPEEQEEIRLYEQNDITVAILNYTYGTNGIPLPEDMPYAVDLLEESRVRSDLQRAEELADFTVVVPHWGTEYRLSPDSMQEKWTRIFLEEGADLVLGAHPHVIEPVEWVGTEEDPEQMLVYYSLGNFVNWTSGTGDGTANRMVGGMAEVTIGRDPVTGEVEITDYGIRALVCHVRSGIGGVTVYDLADYTDALAGENEILKQDGHFSRDYCVDLCDNVWGDLWY